MSLPSPKGGRLVVSAARKPAEKLGFCPRRPPRSQRICSGGVVAGKNPVSPRIWPPPRRPPYGFAGEGYQITRADNLQTGEQTFCQLAENVLTTVTNGKGRIIVPVDNNPATLDPRPPTRGKMAPIEERLMPPAMMSGRGGQAVLASSPPRPLRGGQRPPNPTVALRCRGSSGGSGVTTPRAPGDGRSPS